MKNFHAIKSKIASVFDVFFKKSHYIWWRQITSAILFVCALSSCANVKSADSIRGNYYWGHEVESFHPCGSDQSFWVVGSASVLQMLREEALRLSKARGQPYQPLYVEASAFQEGKPEDGFAADYDGVYRFILIKTFSASIPSDCATK